MITDDEVMRVLEQANPISVDDPIAMLDIARYRDIMEARNTTTTIIDTEATSIPPDSRHRWLIITAAAAVAVTVGGLVLAARDDNETGVGSDPPRVILESATTAPHESGDEPSEDEGQLPAIVGPVTTAPHESGVEPDEDEGAAARVGFIGLPPEGATPSTPESGVIVVSILACYAPIGDISEVDPFPPLGALWVLADGRLIWLKFENLPEGANSLSTGLLEQRLTPEGVDLMASARDAAFNAGDVVLNHCAPDDRGYVLSDSGNVAPGTISSDSEHLTRIIDPWSWLPATAWEDPEITAYVPSTYLVTYEAYGDGLNGPDPRELAFRQLPAAVADLLDTKFTCGCGWGGVGDHGSVDGTGGTVTTDEARSLAAALDDAGLEQDALLNAYRLDYQLDFHDETLDVVVHVRFYAMPPGCESWDQSCSPMGIGSLMNRSGV